MDMPMPSVMMWSQEGLFRLELDTLAFYGAFLHFLLGIASARLDVLLLLPDTLSAGCLVWLPRALG
jgi:hypothetical protein